LLGDTASGTEALPSSNNDGGNPGHAYFLSVALALAAFRPAGKPGRVALAEF
jgi:hypothetical protein